ncbi:hypothetical protein HF1_14170 [Mycoplasma haemofelis str. Langford 1]|uniref:Uncharacterized protein n=1 Tax=Mycoplasma haemofelis (strain Langford 1) TaxID=941640 RepID=E8ZJV4_MYCHL|nr:hypothetical protein [Mycoplasma haemofelis]CBY93425.1 hypothetical protein HF1_14170 [Mycoplasma haemofelis str. Langford 1]
MKLKIALGALGCCGVGGISYFSLAGGEKLISNTTREEEKPLFEGKVLLDTSSNKDSERWRDLSYAYSRAEGNLLISSISKSSAKSDVADQLKNWCKEKLGSGIQEGERETVKRWCTVPNNIKEKLKSEGYVSLPSYNDSDDESLGRWNKIFEKYGEAFEGEEADKVIGVDGYTKENTKSADERRQFSEKCQEQLTYDMPEDTQDKVFVSSQKWCMWKD